MGGAERGGREDHGAPDTARARRGGAVSISPLQPHTRRLLPEQREPQQLRVAAAAAGLCAPARWPPSAAPLVSPQLFPSVNLFELSGSFPLFASCIVSPPCIFTILLPLSLATLLFFSFYRGFLLDLR